MENIGYQLNLDFEEKRLGNATKPHVDQVVRDIRRLSGFNTDIQVRVEEEGRALCSVAITVFGLGEAIHAKKVGKKPIPTLKKVKRMIQKRIRKKRKSRISGGRRFWRPQHAS